MQGIYLKFYVQENRRHHGILAYEWLLEEARKVGIHGGSAFRGAMLAPCPQAITVAAVTSRAAQARRRREDRIGTNRQPTD